MQPVLPRKQFAVAKLPPELLYHIFRHSSPDFDDPSTDLDDCVRWLRTTHVCHDWREVAIDFASLWSTVVLEISNPYISSLFLKRSGSLPLSIVCKTITVSTPWLVILDLYQHRIKHLRIQGLKTYIIEFLKSIKEHTLQSLVVISSSETSFWPLDTPFVDDAPSLTTLSMTRCAFELTSPLYTSKLTTLSFQNLSSTQRFNLTQIASLLGGLPQLTSLTLINALTISAPRAPNSTAMKNLCQLHLEAEQRLCFNLLSMLAVPELDDIMVSYLDNTSLGLPKLKLEIMSAVFSLIVPLIPSSPPLTELRLRDDYFAEELQLRTSSGSVVKIRSTAQNPSERLTGNAMAAVYSQPDLMGHITFLDIRVAFDAYLYLSFSVKSVRAYPETWISLFSALPSVRTLRIRSERPLLIFETLFEWAMRCIGLSRNCAHTDHIGEDGCGQQLLPQLRIIEFVDVSFFNGPRRKIKRRTFLELPIQELILALLCAIRWHPYSTPPNVSLIRCSGVDPQWVHELRKHTWVSWDGESVSCARPPRKYWVSPEDLFVDMVAWYDTLDDAPSDAEVCSEDEEEVATDPDPVSSPEEESDEESDEDTDSSD